MRQSDADREAERLAQKCAGHAHPRRLREWMRLDRPGARLL
jgi:hypothetical protein